MTKQNEEKPFPPFFTVAQRPGTEGTEYVLTVRVGEDERVVSLYDGDNDYWVLANLIDRLFPVVEEAK